MSSLGNINEATRDGNGWLRLEGIGSTTGGEDLRLESNWRMTCTALESRGGK